MVSRRSFARLRSHGGRQGGAPAQAGLRALDPETALTETAAEDHPEFWSRDGKTLLFIRRTADDAQGAWALQLADGKVELLLDPRFRVDEPQLSPDERWLAYLSRESGRDEVYVEPYRRAGDLCARLGRRRGAAQVAGTGRSSPTPRPATC